MARSSPRARRRVEGYYRQSPPSSLSLPIRRTGAGASRHRERCCTSMWCSPRRPSGSMPRWPPRTPSLTCWSGCAPGIAISELSVQKPTLDEVFLTLTGRPPTLQTPSNRTGGQRSMSQMTLLPGIERKLKNRVSVGQTVRDSLLMGYRGLLKIRRTPEQFSM